MATKQKLLIVGLTVIVAGVVLWIGLDAVMRGVTEMERNMGGSRQVVKEDSTQSKDG
ncbi:hypothetical protein [Halococcus sp. AFM35]|uniref:hypothetical protein n=1 Tax=Halococcus sp. AFM35 TaxID=3421653 RepID=UPI003EBD3A7B